MALQTLNTIKNWFKTGLKPTQTQFWDTWDSFRHKYEKVSVKDVDGIDELLLFKADKVVLDNHLADKNAHAPQVNTDWNSESGFSQLLNKPEFKTINGEPLTGDGNIVIEAGGSQNLQTTLGNGNETTNGIMFNDDYYNWLKTSIDSRSIRLTDSNSDMLVAIDSAGVVTRDDSQHVSLNPQGIFFNRDTAESYLRINSASTGVSSINLPITTGTEITLATTNDFKTINGESIVGEGDITLSGGLQNLQQVLDAGNSTEDTRIILKKGRNNNYIAGDEILIYNDIASMVATPTEVSLTEGELRRSELVIGGLKSIDNSGVVNNLNYPNKPEGTYTIATREDIAEAQTINKAFESHLTDENAHQNLLTIARIIPYGEVLVFKTSPEGNPKIKESSDFCLGYINGVFISGTYSGNNSYDIKSGLEL